MASVDTIFVGQEGGEIIKINAEDLAAWEARGFAECEAPKGEAPVMTGAGAGEEVVINAKMSKADISTALEDEKYAEIADKVDMSLPKAAIVEQIEELMTPADPEGDEGGDGSEDDE